MHCKKYKKKNDQVVTLVEIEKENEQVIEEQSLTIRNVQQSTSTEKIESQLVCIHNNCAIL